MSNTKIVLDNFLTSLQKRDLDSMISLYAESVRWEIPGNTADIKWLGKRSNHAEIKEFFQLLWSSTKPLDAQIHRVFIENEEVMIKGVFTTEMLETSKTVTSLFFIHFVVKEDKIVEYTLLEDSYSVSLSLQK